jgi:hypothetical protein
MATIVLQQGLWLNAPTAGLALSTAIPTTPDNVRTTTNLASLIENTVRYLGMDVEDMLPLANSTCSDHPNFHRGCIRLPRSFPVVRFSGLVNRGNADDQARMSGFVPGRSSAGSAWVLTCVGTFSHCSPMPPQTISG